MYRISQTSTSVTIVEFRWFWAMLCVVFFVTTALGVWQAYRAGDLDWFKGAVMVLALVGTCIGAVLFSTYTTYHVDGVANTLTWQRTRLGQRAGGTLAFDDVQHVGVESQRRSTLTLTRAVVFSEKGDVPLSTVFSGRHEETKLLAESVRRLVFPDAEKDAQTVLLANVRELVRRNQTLQATALLAQEGGMSLAQARERVKALITELDYNASDD